MKGVSIAVGLMVVGFAGCANGPTGLESPIHPYDFRGYTGADGQATVMANVVASLDQNADDCRKNPTETCRNEVVGKLKDLIDEYWRKFKSDFNGRVGYTNTAFDGTTSTLTAAAAITTPETAKNILSALATSLLAIRTSAQRNILGDQTAVVLIGQMDSDRLVIGARIENGLDQDVKHYTFNRAMSDVSEYASSMSIIAALISLQRAGGANAQKVKDEQANAVLQDTRKKTADTALLAAQVEEAAAQAEANAKRLRQTAK
jgi:hypothetical protein